MTKDAVALVLSPVVGGLIGWLTNYVAIRMLFRPKRPWRIPVIGYTIQGLIPKRREDLARSIGEVVEQELVTADDLVAKFRSSGVGDDVVETIVAHARSRIRENIPGFVPPVVRQWLLDAIGDLVRAETAGLVGKMMVWAEDRLRSDGRLGQIVEEKIAQFDLDRLEAVVLRVSGTELKAIEILGGVLGFIIGLAQAGIMIAVR